MAFDEDGKNSLWYDAEQLELRQGMSFHLCLRHRLIAVLHLGTALDASSNVSHS